MRWIRVVVLIFHGASRIYCFSRGAISCTKGSSRMIPINGDQRGRNIVARITGGFYLAFMLASFLANSLGHIGLGSAQQVHESIVTNVFSFRLGLVVALISAFLFLMSAWGLYVLLRPVNNYLALLFLFLNAIGVAIQSASLLSLVSAMLQGDHANGMQAFTSSQMEGLSFLSINIYKTGFVAAQLFFGMWLFPLGYLIYKSNFFPRVLGVLLMLDGIAELIWFFQALLWPTAPAAIRYPGTAVSFVAEAGLALWLLIRGAEIANSPIASSGTS